MIPRMRRAILIGMAFGAGALHLTVVGVLLMLHQRWIVVDTVSLGQAVLVAIAGGAGAMAGRPLLGVLAGAMAGVPIAALTVVMAAVPLQSIFIALSPDLLNMLTLGLGTAAGVGILLGGGAVAGLLGAALRVSPPVLRRAIIPGAVAVLVAGVFQELIQLMLQQYEGMVGVIPRLPLHLGGSQPARRSRGLHLCRAVQRGHRRGAAPPDRTLAGARPAARTHDLGRTCIVGSCAASGDRRLLRGPGADAGRAVHPDGHGPEP